MIAKVACFLYLFTFVFAMLADGVPEYQPVMFQAALGCGLLALVTTGAAVAGR